MKEYLCSGINHPWQIKPPIVVLKNGSRRIRLECQRCGSIRYDTRSQHGVIQGRAYDHSDDYDKFLESTGESKNRRLDAWQTVIKETATHEGNDTTLRLVRDKTKKLRHRNPRPVKRSRGKKRANA
jgi:hypothetical protein